MRLLLRSTSENDLEREGQKRSLDVNAKRRKLVERPLKDLRLFNDHSSMFWNLFIFHLGYVDVVLYLGDFTDCST